MVILRLWLKMVEKTIVIDYAAITNVNGSEGMKFIS